MTNHYHLLIETPEKNLSRILHYLNSSYTTYTNIKRKRSGHLFQGRYKAILVDRDSYLLELSRTGSKMSFFRERRHLTKKRYDHPAELMTSCPLCAQYGITQEVAVSAQRNDVRKVVIYLMKKQSAASNHEIGEAVGGMSGFAVAKAYQRLTVEMVKDRVLRKKVEEMACDLSRVNG